MNHSKWLVTLSAAGVLSLAAIGSPAVAETAQQAKMTSCNADAKAKGLTGDDRKTFMKTCLAAKPSDGSKPLNSQQTKMKSCNAEATVKGLKGADRKAYMTSCLKGTATP
jgi:hypothetical protein